MIGDYKFSNVKNGIGYFARVVVEVQPFSDKGLVIDAIAQQVNRSQGEVNVKTHGDWVSAAVEGANETLRYLEGLGEINTYIIKITKIIGIETDTTEDTVKVAASLATWQAINPNKPEPKTIFDGQWSVVFT
jgi:hypothetical protein